MVISVESRHKQQHQSRKPNDLNELREEVMHLKDNVD